MKRVLILVCAILFATACNSTPAKQSSLPGGPRAWIDAPLDGTQRPLAPLEIVSHTSDGAYIAQVELSVNGAVVRADPNPNLAEVLVTTHQMWTPPGPGNYTLQVRALSTAGIWGDYAKSIVTIAGGGVVQGTVYTDLNGNGLPNDPGDAPLDGVTVALSGCASKTTTTANGTFQFADLPAGTCLVQVSKPGWKFSGTFPAGIGYPAQVASDPAKPTAFSLFMTPLVTPTSTPTSAAKPGTPTPTPTQGSLPAVTIAFFADQLTLVSGQCTTIHWQVTNASQVFLDNASVAATGSKVDCPTQTTTHVLRVVTLDRQTTQRSLTLTVRPGSTPTRTATPPPAGCVGTPNIASFYASPSAITQGQSTTLNWGTVTNADSVEIDQGIGRVGAPGSRSVSPGQTTTYTLTAHCGRNTLTRQATVAVTAPPRVTWTPTTPPDNTGPTIGGITTSTTYFYRSGCGPSSITVNANISDPSGISNAVLYHRVGSGSFTSATMSATGGNNFRVTVNGSSIPGYAYGTWSFYIVAWDTRGNMRQSSTNSTVSLNECVR